MMPGRSKEDQENNQQNDSPDNPTEHFPSLGVGVAAFAPQLVCSTVAVPDIDTLEVLYTTQLAATYALRSRCRRTGVALRPCPCRRRRSERTTTVRARFGFPRNLTAALRARDERHGLLQRMRSLI